jgi:polysaccharide chain length determinant protein (PEP-CTERM system associated)
MTSLYDEFRVALHHVWQRRWLALAVAWGVCLLGWLVVSMIPNNYESEARVFAQMRSLLPDKIGLDPNARQSQIDRVQRTLTSTENLEKVVRGTQLAELAPNNRAVTEMALGLRDNIKVLAQQENLFQVTASANSGSLSDAENARLARAMVQKLIDIFVEENLRSSLGETTQSLQFLDQELKQREVQLQEAEAKRVAFEQKYMGLLPGVGSVDQRMAQARQELNQVESNLLAAQSSLAAVNGQLASTAPTVSGPSIPVPVGGGNGGGGARARASQLEGQVAEAQSRGWTDNHPDMVSLKGQLARARAAAASEGPGGGGFQMMPGSQSPNPFYSTLRSMQAERQASVAALSARKGQLQSELAQFAARQVDEPSVAAEQQRLNRDYEVLKTKYDELLAEREKMRLLSQVQSENGTVKFRVIDPPSSPRKPTAPDRPLLLTGVLLFGLLTGIGVAFGMSQLQAKYVNAPRLEKASGLRVIGSISESLTFSQKTDRKRRMKLFYAGGAALAGVFALLLVVEMVQRGGVA